MKRKEVLLISVIIFLTIIAWILAEIYHIINTEQVKAITPEVVRPITVHIDPSVFSLIEGKK